LAFAVATAASAAADANDAYSDNYRELGLRIAAQESDFSVATNVLKAAISVCATVYDDHASNAAFSSVVSAASAVSAIARTGVFISSQSAYETTARKAWVAGDFASVSLLRATYGDANFIASGGSASAFTNRPLWPDGPPARTGLHNQRAAFPTGAEWDIWTKWYQDILAGSPVSETNAFGYATVPNEIWQKGAEAARKWIKERV
jgi:hypothetical protein